MKQEDTQPGLEQHSSFGVLLRRARERAGLTQEVLAERAGLTPNAISALERSERRHPYPATVSALSTALELSEDQRIALMAAIPERRKSGANITSPPRLPVLRTLLIGRERQLADIAVLLERDDYPIVTLTGPGGVGKTRLAIQAASRLSDAFPDGVWFIGLASINDASLVIPAIAQELGVRESSSEPLNARLKERIRGKELLLVLDNFEHLLDAGPALAGLLSDSPRSRILVTSRERLRLTLEREYDVPPLELPDANCDSSMLMQTEGVRFFADRAQAIQADFALTEANAEAIASICRHLDGLPLAIELAAAWITLLPPESLLARLDKRLPLLTGGARDLPRRQQTMRDTIAWSYDLLTLEEQRLFRGLSVFNGGCSLAAAEVVLGEQGRNLITEMSTLREKRLLRRYDGRDGEPRFAMLETICEFAQEELTKSGEEISIRDRHADWCLELAEQDLEWGTVQFNQIGWLRQVETEHANMRAAIVWLEEIDDGPRMVRLTTSLQQLWFNHSHLAEGIVWLERARLRVAQSLIETRIWLLCGLAHALERHGEHDRGAEIYEEWRALVREHGTPFQLAHVTHSSGVRLANLGCLEEGKQLVEQAQVIFRDLLAVVEYGRGDYARGIDRIEPVIHQRRRDGDVINLAVALDLLALLECEIGNAPAAVAAMQEALPLWRMSENKEGLAELLAVVARLALLQGRLDTAAQLYGASEALSEFIGSPLLVPPPNQYGRAVDQLKASMGEAMFNAAFSVGGTLDLDDAIDLASSLLNACQSMCNSAADIRDLL
jgi:predicted ATPase/DNA-binding XRE family transcriptional regulator